MPPAATSTSRIQRSRRIMRIRRTPRRAYSSAPAERALQGRDGNAIVGEGLGLGGVDERLGLLVARDLVAAVEDRPRELHAVAVDLVELRPRRAVGAARDHVGKEVAEVLAEGGVGGVRPVLGLAVLRAAAHRL